MRLLTRKGILFALHICIILLAAAAALSGDSVYFREDFHSLDEWRPFYFPKIKKHTKYITETDGAMHYLKTESNASASALVYKKEFNIFEYPKVRLRWKVGNIYKRAVPGTKEGDDYPLRIYIIFKYDSGKAGFFEKIRYEAAKAIYGEYPPDSTLSYVWASSPDVQRISPSPYTARGQLIALQRGPEKVGEWVEEAVDVLKDYSDAFGKQPPATASMAIMNDSDNTGEKSVSYLEYIEIYK